MSFRNIYARAFGRLQMQQGNRFWTPFDLNRHLTDFRRVSNFHHYKKVDDFFDSYPFYLPYGHGEWRQEPSLMMKAYYFAVSPFGRFSHYFLPTLAGTFERHNQMLV
jgi:hypothetical protein